MKKKDMTVLIEGLRKLSADAAQIADALEGTPVKETKEPVKEPEVTEEAPAAEEVPVEEEAPTEEAAPEKTYSFEEVRGFLGELSKTHRAEVKALVNNHGGTSLSSYKDQPDILAALMKEAEVIANA